MAPQQNDDRAIVIGIDRYPKFGATVDSPNDLHGPVNDALDVAAWLRGSAGVQNIRIITSRGEDATPWPPDGNIHPLKERIIQAFDEIIDEGERRAAAFQPRRIGRRLYVYMAGHGFAPSPRDVALIMANARQKIQVHNLLATKWSDWFCTQTYFDEFVLWMDCCSTARVTLIPDTVPYPISAPRPGGRGKVVIAVAAKFGQTGHELPLGPAGEIRGCFTHALTRGLRGAAADQSGSITTSSLEGYLSNAFQNNPADPLWPSATDQEPEFLQKDQIEFANVGARLPEYHLIVPLADDTRVNVVAGHFHNGSYETIASSVVKDGKVAIRLAAGLYKATTPSFERLFEVAAGTQVYVDLN